MSLSDFESDLTELESSEEEYAPRKKRAYKKKTATQEYTVKCYLMPPRTAHFTTQSLYDMMMDGAIDLDPPYQRDVVWPETKQVGLIDSILRNYYIPPIIFACVHDSEGSVKRTCIDGKQRLTSIRRFIAGEICHRDPISGKKYWFHAGHGSGASRTLLPNSLKIAFRTKQVVCVEYDNIREEQEREVFQRVQLGVALTPAERMQAISGPWPDLLRSIQSDILGDDGFGEALEWGHARGRDFQCLATIVYLLQPGGQSKTFPGAAQLDKWLQSGTSVPDSKLRADIFLTFKIFLRLAKDPKYHVCFQKPLRVSPIEFTMTGVLIYTFKDKLSFAQLSSAISKMREDVRSKHVDVRANGRVTKTMQMFISRIKPSSLTSDKKGDVPASSVIKEAKKATKRKRAETESESDSEDDQPLRKVSATKATQASRAKTSTSTRKNAGIKETSSSKTVVKKVTTVSTSSSKPVNGSARTSVPSSSANQRKSSSLATLKIPRKSSATQPTVQSQSRASSAEMKTTPTQRGAGGESASQNVAGPSQTPVQVKAEPDLGPSQWPSGSPADRLAPLRESRPGSFSNPTSPIAPEQAQQLVNAFYSTLAQPAQNGGNASQAPMDIVSRIQSMFANNAYNAAQAAESRMHTSATPPTPVPPSPTMSNRSGSTVMKPEDSQRRSSIAPAQSPAAPFSSTNNEHAASAPPLPLASAESRGGARYSAPPRDDPMNNDVLPPKPIEPPPPLPPPSSALASRVLSPTLPVKPEYTVPSLDLPGRDSISATAMAPPTAPRADRHSRWDQPIMSRRDSAGLRGWRDSQDGDRTQDWDRERDRDRDRDRDGGWDREREREKERERERERDADYAPRGTDDYYHSRDGGWRGRGRGRGGQYRPRGGYYKRDY